MLLSGECEVVGLEGSAEPSFVVLDASEDPLISIVGRPAPGAVESAVARAGGACDVLAFPENRSHVAAVLYGWTGVGAVLHRLADDAKLPEVPAGSVTLLSSPEVFDLIDTEGISGDLRSELRAAASGAVPFAAALSEGHPVSFCYVASETEGLWDVAIDTLEGHRRRGHAARCVAYLVAHMREQGKEPIWGAEETNPPSLGLAARLGFVPVDEIVVFHPPGV
jgi:GNAT superfamily N-acetyltransferase